MGTTLPIEYQRAAALLEQFRGGKITLDVGNKRVRYGDLDPAQQARFSIEWLTEQLAQYRRAADAPVKGTGNGE